MGFKLILKYQDDNGTKPTRKEVEKVIFSNLQINVTRLTSIVAGFLVRTDQVQHLDLFAQHREDFNKIKLTVVISKHIEAQKTLIIRRIDDSLLQAPPEAIKKEIIRNERKLFSSQEIHQVIKVNGNARLIKIVCTTHSAAERISKKGFTAFNYRVTPNQISRDNFVSLLTCFRCYSLNEHSTKDCTSTEVQCSNCAEFGHNHKNCQSSIIKCINCFRNGNPHNHHTLAFKCPHRKNIIQEMTKEQEIPQPVRRSSYASAVRPVPLSPATPMEVTTPASISSEQLEDLKKTLLTELKIIIRQEVSKQMQEIRTAEPPQKTQETEPILQNLDIPAMVRTSIQEEMETRPISPLPPAPTTTVQRPRTLAEFFLQKLEESEQPKKPKNNVAGRASGVPSPRRK